MKAQLDLFRASSAAPIDPHIGVPIELPDACKCGCTFARIGAGIGPHRASLRCASCGVHRGWLAREMYDFINEIIRKFGPLTAPITIRRGKGEHQFGI